MKIAFIIGTIAIIALSVIGCSNGEKPLPIYGEKTVIDDDTSYHVVGPFRFVDQDSTVVTNETFAGKIYVADFFFTSCRTICPIMRTQMHRVYRETRDDDDVLFLSHTIDPEYDTVNALKSYADHLGVDSRRWHFVTGESDSLYRVAHDSYFAPVGKDSSAPGGFMHSGAFLLVDSQGRIRGKYDGTEDREIDRLLTDIERLKQETTL